jgi:hypothetical protein
MLLLYVLANFVLCLFFLGFQVVLAFLVEYGFRLFDPGLGYLLLLYVHFHSLCFHSFTLIHLELFLFHIIKLFLPFLIVRALIVLQRPLVLVLLLHLLLELLIVLAFQFQYLLRLLLSVSYLLHGSLLLHLQHTHSVPQ